MSGLILALMLADPAVAQPIPVAIAVARGESETAENPDLKKVVDKFRERLSAGKEWTSARFVADRAASLVVVEFRSKEYPDDVPTVKGALVVGRIVEPFALQLPLPDDKKTQDNALAGLVGKRVEDFIKRNYTTLAGALTKR